MDWANNPSLKIPVSIVGVHSRVGHMFQSAVVGLTVLLALFSLLAFFKAYVHVFWVPAIVATEWSAYFLLASLVCVALLIRSPLGSRVPVIFGIVAVILYASPLVRAIPVAIRLDQRCEKEFGNVPVREGRRAPNRKAPLQWADFVLGIDIPTVIKSVRTYSTSPVPLEMDVFAPAGAQGPLPGIVMVHGGSWSSGDKDELPDIYRYLASRGYLVASVNYRLAPQYPYPAPRDDVFKAIQYLKDHSGELDLDSTHLVLMGRSAGGQIALAAAYTKIDPAIRGVIALYAPSDLLFGYSLPSNPFIMDSRKVLEDYLGGPPSALPGAYEAASPLNYVNAKSPPTLTVHGYRDELVWPIHDERLEGRLAEFKRPHLFLRLPWATHGCEANLSGPSGQLTLYAIEHFLAFVCPTKDEERIAQKGTTEGAAS